MQPPAHDPWAGLRALLAERGIPTRDDMSAEDLGDLLLDHREQLAGPQYPSLLGAALVDRFEELARAHCRREFLLLDPLTVAEDAVVKLWIDAELGTRRRPLTAFAEDYIRDAARTCAGDHSVYLFQPSSDPDAPDALGHRLLHLACGIVNRLSAAHRRIAWLAWVEAREWRDIESLTGVPYERVEALLTDLVLRARNLMDHAPDPSDTLDDDPAAEGTREEDDER